MWFLPNIIVYAFDIILEQLSAEEWENQPGNSA